MNWKLLIGIFLILAGLKIFFAQTNAYMADSIKVYPAAAQLGSVILMLVGAFLIYKGKKKNPPPHS